MEDFFKSIKLIKQVKDECQNCQQGVEKLFGNYVSQAGLEYQKQILYSICSDPIFDQVDCEIDIGKKHALKKYDLFTLNTSCF